MATLSNQPETHLSDVAETRDAAYWAKPVAHLDVSEVPPGAICLNVAGRRVAGPVQGFGQMWLKTYRLRLEGCRATPAEIVRAWKQNLPSYQPPASRFFPTRPVVTPGEVVLINAVVEGMPVLTGVLVAYADAESFTLMTPEGHPESGWVTFSAYRDDTGSVVAQVQSIARANDPLYEFGFRFLGGASQQERIWTEVLNALALEFGPRGDVLVQNACLDTRLQWSQAKNVWHNAMIRSTLYLLLLPLRLRTRKFGETGSTASARTPPPVPPHTGR